MSDHLILTSKCEKCSYSIINDNDKSKIKIFCKYKKKNYYFGQYIPCENFKK